MAHPGVDRHALHWALWEQSTGGVVERTQRDLAEQLGVKRAWAGQLLDSLVEEGRLERIQGRSRYRVVDPAGFS